jgi:ribosomal protein S18 acetylase RimI-like enzyme
MVQLPWRFDPEVSHTLERLAARAWPADEVHDVEGWLLRRTDGVDRRRCNSLLPPADDAHARRTLDLALATAAELDVVASVQVSPAEAHLGLDDALAAMGGVSGGASLVIAGPAPGAAAPAPSAGGSAVPYAIQGGPLTAKWVEAWADVSGLDGTRETAELVLSQLSARGQFCVATDAATGAPLAVGLGVAEDGWLGIFSLATSPAARRRGLASAVVDHLERWGATRGARRSYLQVEADNEPALRFYARRGFHVAHSYHYRTLQP